MKKTNILKTLIITSFLLCTLLVSASATYKLSPWAKSGLQSAVMAGLIDREEYIRDYTAPISRGEIADLLFRAYQNATGEDAPYAENPFTDVYDFKYAALRELGIMSGTGENTFSPDSYTTRQEMAKIITCFKAAVDGETVDPLFDSEGNYADFYSISDWAKPYVCLAQEQELLLGYEDGTFRPTNQVSWEQALTLIERSCYLQTKERPVIVSPANDQCLVTKDNISFVFDHYDNYTLYAQKVAPNASYSYLKNMGSCENNNNILIYPYSFETCSLYYVFAECDGIFSEPVKVYTDSKIIITNQDTYLQAGPITVSWQSAPGVGAYTVSVTETRQAWYGDTHIPANTLPPATVASGNSYTFTGHPNKKYTVVVSSSGYNSKIELYTSPVINDFSGIIHPETKEAAKNVMKTVSVPVWKINSKGQKYSSTASITVHYLIADKVALVFREIYNGPEKFPIKDVGGFSWRNTTTSEHNCGTAIDINSNENYCIYSNGTVVGSFWSPGVSPYSIKPYGDVVRAFEKYGFTWGGDAWASGTRDYMHFSYMGT